MVGAVSAPSSDAPDGQPPQPPPHRRFGPNSEPLEDFHLRKNAPLPPLKKRPTSQQVDTARQDLSSLSPRQPREDPNREAAVRAATSTPTPASGQPPRFGRYQSVVNGFGRGLGVVALVTLVVLFGMVVFAAIEQDAEDASRAEYTAYMRKLQAKYNISDSDLSDLADVVGTSIEYSASSGGDNRQWGPLNYNTLVFAFSIVTTIGYGSFAPATAWGQVQHHC
jgi:hypothetical protein